MGRDREPGWLARLSASFNAERSTLTSGDMGLMTMVAPPTQTVTPPETLVKVKSIREDRPMFGREYSMPLDHRSVKVTARSSSGLGRWLSGELTQSNGRWVLFDPDAIADKILDPALVPLVEKACREIMAIDDEFMASRPRSFVDEGGVTWVRQP